MGVALVQKIITILAVAVSLAVSASSMSDDAGEPLYTGSIQEIGSPAPEVSQAEILIPLSSAPAIRIEEASAPARIGDAPVLLAAYEPTPEIESFVARPLYYFGAFPGQAVKPNVEEPPPAAPAMEYQSRRPVPQQAPDRAERQTRAPVVRIAFTSPILAPMAHTRFCLESPSECKVPKLQFRSGLVKLTPARRAELAKINTKVNRSIRPEANTGGLAAEKWIVAPEAGDCNDYAVTKRHELLARGWPSRALLLAEVVVPSGEHHLVLVVRTNEGDLVADNLNANIRNWSTVGYEWVRIQTPANPIYWAKVARTTVYAELR